jgi:hypothetical protein
MVYAVEGYEAKSELFMYSLAVYDGHCQLLPIYPKMPSKGFNPIDMYCRADTVLYILQ